MSIIKVLSVFAVLAISFFSHSVIAMEFHFTKVADKTYAYIGTLTNRTPENLGLNNNIGLVITDKGAVLIDSGGQSYFDKDYLGVSRVLGGTVDIGAYEYFLDDGDGISPEIDNCPTIANANQIDTDDDKQGDVCDIDFDHHAVWIEDAFDGYVNELVVGRPEAGYVRVRIRNIGRRSPCTSGNTVYRVHLVREVCECYSTSCQAM